MTYCRCGEKVFDGWRYCPACGCKAQTLELYQVLHLNRCPNCGMPKTTQGGRQIVQLGTIRPMRDFLCKACKRQYSTIELVDRRSSMLWLEEAGAAIKTID